MQPDSGNTERPEVIGRLGMVTSHSIQKASRDFNILEVHGKSENRS